MGELQQAIFVERLPRGILRFHGQLQGFWLLMAVCCSWDIVGGFSSMAVASGPVGPVLAGPIFGSS